MSEQAGQLSWRPQEVSDLELAFPSDISRLIPRPEDIPKEYRDGHTWANEFQNDWFFFGLTSFDLDFKEGIDPDLALRHLKAIQGTYEIDHQHKEAAVAFLLDLWTEGEGTWERKKR